MSESGPAGTDDLRLHLLVLRCQAGDERAFAGLMETFSGRTMAYLEGLLSEDAEDVHQEVWLAVYRGIRSLANPGAFRTWLFRTTRHRAIDFLRKRKRERELFSEATVDEDFSDDVTDEIPDAIDAGELDAALAAMPPPHREVLLLRYRDDLSYHEIALVVGCPVGTVRTRLHHAKRRLQQHLSTEPI
jgi:RNA polymerase sigma-70 factor (ECF subfamily)